MISTIISGNLWLLLLMQGTACIGVGIAASYFLRHRPARAHQALLTALLVALLTPGAHILVRHFGLGALAAGPVTQTPEHETGDSFSMRTSTDSVAPPTPDEQETYPSYVSLAPEVGGTPAALSTVTPISIAPARSAATTRVPWGVVTAVVWIATSALLLLRLILRFLLGLQLLRTAEPLASARLQQAVEAAKSRLGIAGPIRILGSERLRSPVIWCWARRPVLLVHGEAARQEDDVDWVGVFCHELAHLRRHDHLSGLFVEVLTVLFPWHPLLWWARGRLVRLSEQACDDWVLAAGQTGVDYAESLLDLAPQRQIAILPTVVGKEKAMKERIHRIIKDGCGNPTVGLRWAAGISVLAMLAVVSVAVAQRRPAPPEPQRLEGGREAREPRAREENRERVMALRRRALERMLEETAGRIRERETVLRERGDELGEERPVIEFELEVLHEQAEQIERRLLNLQQPGRAWPEPIPPEPRRERGEALRPGPPLEEIEAHLGDLRRHREELAQETGRIERELQGLRDDQDEEARELRARLQELHSAMGNVEREMAELQQRAHAQVELAKARERAERARAEARQAKEATEQMQELARRRRELQVHLREIQRELEKRPDQESEEARALRREHDRIQDEIAVTERELEDVQRARPTFERERRAREPGTLGAAPSRPRPEPSPPLERQVDELRNQMNELREQMQQMRELLEQSLQRR
jgi:beta-lactamase regulating signal transducer with metallopeptidase domain